jgi:hypothetical protein
VGCFQSFGVVQNFLALMATDGVSWKVPLARDVCKRSRASFVAQWIEADLNFFPSTYMQSKSAQSDT